MEHTAEQPAEQPAEPQPLDALMFQAWTTIYSTYRLYFAATYERPLPVQAAASNIDLRFNIGNFKLQVAGDHIRNGANVTGREVVVMSTIFAMSAAAFLGFIVYFEMVDAFLKSLRILINMAYGKAKVLLVKDLFSFQNLRESEW
ncbi:hypothetical protein QL285_018351 [Trifolium repens]|nr:hypothetical protein QL285_018351 [Trifolium repens]